jgi:hypothetical protein
MQTRQSSALRSLRVTESACCAAETYDWRPPPMLLPLPLLLLLMLLLLFLLLD